MPHLTRGLRRLAILAAAMLMLLPHRASAADEVIDRVLAIAGGEIIMLSDVRAARELRRVDPGDAGDPTRVVLRQLIDRALVLAEVDRFAPPEPTPAVVAAALDGVVVRFPSERDFDATLERLGLNRAIVAELLKEDLRIRAYLDQRFTATTIDEQQTMIDSWISGLRRRGDVVELY